MLRIIAVGLGALGSTTCQEIAKRCYAIEFPLQMTLVDFDVVQKRNVAAQFFSPVHLDKLKAEAVETEMLAYGIDVNIVTEKITNDNISQLLQIGQDGEDIILDMVDNLETRHLLWQFGLAKNIPVLHAGMSKAGSGNVDWSLLLGEEMIDNFCLSPKNISAGTKKALLDGTNDVELPPCELNAKRGLILNTSLATVNALFMFLGQDSLGLVTDPDVIGSITSWSTTNNSWQEFSEVRREIS